MGRRTTAAPARGRPGATPATGGPGRCGPDPTSVRRAAPGRARGRGRRRAPGRRCSPPGQRVRIRVAQRGQAEDVEQRGRPRPARPPTPRVVAVHRLRGGTHLAPARCGRLKQSSLCCDAQPTRRGQRDRGARQLADRRQRSARGAPRPRRATVRRGRRAARSSGRLPPAGTRHGESRRRRPPAPVQPRRERPSIGCRHAQPAPAQPGAVQSWAAGSSSARAAEHRRRRVRGIRAPRRPQPAAASQLLGEARWRPARRPAPDPGRGRPGVCTRPATDPSWCSATTRVSEAASDGCTDRVAHLDARGVVEHRGRLVEQQHLRVEGEGSGQGEPRALSARQRVGRPVGAVGEGDRVERAGDPGLDLLARQRAVLRTERDVAPDVLGDDAVSRVLQQQPDRPGAALGVGPPRRHAAGELAGRLVEQPGERAQQRRLPRTARPRRAGRVRRRPAAGRHRPGSAPAGRAGASDSPDDPQQATRGSPSSSPERPGALRCADATGSRPAANGAQRARTGQRRHQAAAEQRRRGTHRRPPSRWRTGRRSPLTTPGSTDATRRAPRGSRQDPAEDRGQQRPAPVGQEREAELHPQPLQQPRTQSRDPPLTAEQRLHRGGHDLGEQRRTGPADDQRGHDRRHPEEPVRRGPASGGSAAKRGCRTLVHAAPADEDHAEGDGEHHTVTRSTVRQPPAGWRARGG